MEKDYIIKVRTRPLSAKSEQNRYQLSGVDVEAEYDIIEALLDALRKVLEKNLERK